MPDLFSPLHAIGRQGLHDALMKLQVLFEIAYEIRLPTPVMLPGRGMYCCTDNIRYCTTHSNVRTHVWPIPSSKNTRRPELLCTGIGVPVSLVPGYASGNLKQWSTLRVCLL